MRCYCVWWAKGHREVGIHECMEAHAEAHAGCSHAGTLTAEAHAEAAFRTAPAERHSHPRTGPY